MWKDACLALSDEILQQLPSTHFRWVRKAEGTAYTIPYTHYTLLYLQVRKAEGTDNSKGTVTLPVCSVL
jgi:hypothetical protein